MINLGQMEVDIKSKLTTQDKKELMTIITQEFCNKQSLFHAVQEQEREKIMEVYRKSVGYGKLKKEHEKATEAVKKAQKIVEACQKKITDTGLTIDGDPDDTRENVYDHSAGQYRVIWKAKAIDLQKKLEVLEKNAPSENLKNKLLVRLQLASTKGEALVIMKQVLGNNELPDVDIKQITFEQ